LPILAERGYLIPAVGKVYEACANRLADSIQQFHPNANITILTRDQLPHGDLGGYANDWQVFRASPYRQTIKLEADMLIAGPIEHWWTMFEHRDLVVSTGCRDFYGNLATSRYYRKFIDDNHLPDVYNAITYWRLSKTAQEFFDLVRNIFEHWVDYKQLVKFPEDTPSTDFVYAMAAQIIGPELVTMPFATYPNIVHMKRHVIGTNTNNWTQELVWELDPLRIQTVTQWGAFHYNIKDWLAR
jgi:hypothetical protein